MIVKQKVKDINAREARISKEELTTSGNTMKGEINTCAREIQKEAKIEERNDIEGNQLTQVQETDIKQEGKSRTKDRHAIQVQGRNDDRKSESIIAPVMKEEKKLIKAEPYRHPHYHEVRWRNYTRTSPKQWFEPMRKTRSRDDLGRHQSRTPIRQCFEGKSSQEGEAYNDPNRRAIKPIWRTYSCSSIYKPWRPMLRGRSMLRRDGMLCNKTITYGYG